MSKEQTIVRFVLIFLSLVATFLFLVGIGSGIGSVFFAITGTVTQAAALVFLPKLINHAWSTERYSVLLTSVTALLAVLVISVTGSASVLSGLIEKDIRAAHEYDQLTQLVHLKQKAADRYVAMDRIKVDAKPLFAEIERLNTKIAALPEPSGFYLAAKRIAGNQANTLITVTILLLAMLLDAVIVLLGITMESVKHVTQADRGNTTSFEPLHLDTESSFVLDCRYRAVLEGVCRLTLGGIRQHYKVGTAGAYKIIDQLKQAGLIEKDEASNRYVLTDQAKMGVQPSAIFNVGEPS